MVTTRVKPSKALLLFPDQQCQYSNQRSAMPTRHTHCTYCIRHFEEFYSRDYVKTKSVKNIFGAKDISKCGYMFAQVP